MADPLSKLSVISNKYGWYPSVPDARDFIAQPQLVGTRPTVFSMRGQMPTVYDQGNSGSCTANAISAAIDYNEGRAGRPFLYPSRLFCYYNSRVIENDTGIDGGATVRDAIKAVVTLGVCSEVDWSFDLTKMFVRPPPNCYNDATPHVVTEYAQVGANYGPSVDDLCNQLAGNEPIVFGTAVYTSFESSAVAQTGLVPLPNLAKEKMLGGHCLCIVGYDDSRQLFEVRNSWGTSWGDDGYCWIPYVYMTNPNITQDFWVVRRVLS